MSNNIADDQDCSVCGTTAQPWQCRDCGVVARLTNCGHLPQPRPIASFGSYALCEYCHATRPRKAAARQALLKLQRALLDMYAAGLGEETPQAQAVHLAIAKLEEWAAALQPGPQ